jgi:hypothetical protein
MTKNGKTTGKSAIKSVSKKAAVPASKTKRPKLTLVGGTTATAAGKAGKKLVAKTTAKVKPKAAATKTAKTATAKGARAAPATAGSSVIWKFLEMKEAKRKEHSAQVAGGTPTDKGQGPNDDRANVKHDGFARFSGPRRRAAVAGS